jgi:hypothetical protein
MVPPGECALLTNRWYELANLGFSGGKLMEGHSAIPTMRWNEKSRTNTLVIPHK